MFQCYELVMFTRHAIDIDAAKSEKKAIGRAHKVLNAVLNCIAPYSAQATLNPNGSGKGVGSLWV